LKGGKKKGKGWGFGRVGREGKEKPKRSSRIPHTTTLLRGGKRQKKEGKRKRYSPGSPEEERGGRGRIGKHRGEWGGVREVVASPRNPRKRRGGILRIRGGKKRRR